MALPDVDQILNSIPFLEWSDFKLMTGDEPKVTWCKTPHYEVHGYLVISGFRVFQTMRFTDDDLLGIRDSIIKERMTS